MSVAPGPGLAAIGCTPPCLLLMGPLLLCAAAGEAAEQRLDWSLRSGYEHNDNTRLSDSDRQSLAGLFLTPRAAYQRDNGIDKIRLDSEVSLSRFNRSQYDIESHSATANYSRTLQRHTFTLALESARQPTRITEIDDTGNSDGAASHRDDSGGSLSWQYLLDPNNLVQLSGAFQSTRYASDEFSDFDYYNLASAWQRSLSTRLSLQSQLYYTQFESGFSQRFSLSPQIVDNTVVFPPVASAAGEVTTESTTLGLQLGFEWQLTEKLATTFNAGTAAVDTEQIIDIPVARVPVQGSDDAIFGGRQSADSDSQTYTFESEISYQQETGRLALSASRSTQASGNGSLTEFDNLTLTFERELSERSQLNTRLRAGRRRTLDGDIISLSDQNRRFYDSSISYRLRFAETWWASVSLRYQTQEFPDRENSGSAEALSGLVAITYRPRLRIW